MPRCSVLPVAGLLAALALGGRPAQAQGPAPITALRIDPLLIATVREYRNVIRTVGADLFPGWRANAVPMLLYRPGVQEVLIGAPRVPPGFRRFTGRTLLAGETIYARDDSTVMDLDDQNTSIDLDSMRVLVVADPYSRMRNQLRAMFDRPAEVRDKWIAGWNFVPSPFDDLKLMLHESFHVHQHRLAPDKNADEGAVASYPVLDPANNAYTALEGLILRDALLTADAAVRREKAAEFVAVRAVRRAGLDTTAVRYEDLNEFSEGLGRYVELRFLQLAPRITPTAEMYLHTGFNGYRGAAEREFRDQAEDLARVAGNCDDRFGNQYGGGPLRFRLYFLGAAQGLLLDQIAPAWKGRIFGNEVSLTGLLTEALALSPAQRGSSLDRAKRAYGYDKILAEKEAFASAGRARIQARVDSIRGTAGTLVTIQYGAVGDKMGMGYTPFGVTAISERSAIYDMVPIGIRFANRVLLQMNTIVPTIVDKAARTVTFAIATPASSLVRAADGGLSASEFTLSGAPGTSVTVDRNQVVIVLH